MASGVIADALHARENPEVVRPGVGGRENYDRLEMRMAAHTLGLDPGTLQPSASAEVASSGTWISPAGG